MFNLNDKDMITTEIYNSERSAHIAAKRYFANVLSISPRSVRVSHDTYNERRYGSTRCRCGETRCYYYYMNNAGKIQQQRLEKVIDRPLAIIMLGVCENCGESI